MWTGDRTGSSLFCIVWIEALCFAKIWEQGEKNMQNHYPFEKEPLPYDYSGLMPYCDPDTLYLHYQNLYCSYVDMLNFLLSSYPQLHTWTLQRLMSEPLNVPVTQERQIKHFAGAVHHHDLYFNGLADQAGRGMPEGKLNEAISDHYGSLEQFKKIFKQAAFHVLGSGWVWLNSTGDGNIHIAITEDNKSPKLQSVTPVLVADVWEHAYYLRYPTQMNDYLEAWFSVLNWKQAERLFAQSLAIGSRI